jgi:hypothetical protein
VKDSPRCILAGRVPGQERRERLAGLGVAGQPVVGAGPGNRVESLLIERALKHKRQPGGPDRLAARRATTSTICARALGTSARTTTT